MFKFEFHDPDTEIITHQLLGHHHTLTEVIEAFEQFLLGAGYSFPKGASLGYEYEEETEEDIRLEPLDVFEALMNECPHDPRCHGKSLGTCDACAYNKPGNCS